MLYNFEVLASVLSKVFSIKFEPVDGKS